MKKQLRLDKLRLIPCVLIITALPSLLAADGGDARKAAQNVDEGLEHFQQGQFEQASDAFKRADTALPDDARIAFNQACAAAASAAGGKTADADLAVELFQKAAASTDPSLAAASRYCLGCMAALEARSAFGETPQDAAPEVRSEGLESLDRAVTHYRDALKLDPQYEDARYNRELIHHWVERMKDLWRQRDRQKERAKLNLIDYVLKLEEEQKSLRTQAKSLATQPDTPLWREQLDEAKKAQRELAEEIGPLKEKIAAAIAQPQAAPGGQVQPGAAAVPTDDIKKAVALLSGLADQVGTEMTTAADQLHSARANDALAAQAAAEEMLDQIYMAVVPYPALVKRAVDTQRELVGRTSGEVAPKAPAEGNEVDKSQQTAENSTEEKTDFDSGEEARRQRFVTRWSEVMVAKAKQGLKQMPPVEEEKLETEEEGGAKPASGLVDEKKKKMEGLRKSMELAVKLGPQVETLTDEAADDLDDKKVAAALPKQKESLRLLEEIAKPLEDQNKQNQQQQDQNQQQKQDQKQQQQQNNKDQKNQDQKNKDQDKNNKDQKDQDQKNKDQKKKQQDKKEDKKKDAKDKKDEKKKDKKEGEKDKKKLDDKNKGKQDKPKPKDQKKKESPDKAKNMKGGKPMSKDQKKAEAALRRARQRQQERREMEKAIEAQLYRSGTVEKDW